MTSVRHVARAVGSIGRTTPPYRVDLQVRAHELVADEPSDRGGGDLGPSPFGLLASALAACTAITLRMYAIRKGWELTSLEVDVRYDLRDDDTASFARTVSVPRDLDDEQRERLAEVAERTPVTLAVRSGTPILTTFTSIEA
ncbi:MAG: putative redox protein [Actinomycetota bacterium]|nr:putative redox protein [Actinomycetota bacterium]